MKDIAIIEGDISLEHFVEGTYEAAQCLSIELGTRLGEWFDDDEYGTDFSVLQDKPEDDDIVAEIARVVANEESLETDGDIEVVQDRSARQVVIYIPLMNIATKEGTGLEVDWSGID